MKHPLLFTIICILPALAQAQSFAPFTTYSAGSPNSPTNVALGDINNDGFPDIVTANGPGNTIGVFFNKKDGTFAPTLTYATGLASQPRGIAISDLNNDGYPDIVTANYANSTAGVLLNAKNGTFASIVTYSVGSNSQPYNVVAGDLNKDGYPDIVTVNTSDNTVGILLNKKDGTFAAVVSCALGAYSQPNDVALSDVNGDNYLDIITANTAADAAGVLLNKKDGTFATATSYPTGVNSRPYNIAVSDVNSDGYPDIVTANSFTSNTSVLFNQKDGTFSPFTTYPVVTNNQPCDVALSDINGDGYPDIVTTNFASDGAARVLLNKKDGTFTSAMTYSVGSNSYPLGLAVGDVNKDGKPDIITANIYSSSISVLLNQTLLAVQTSAILLRSQVSLYPNPTSSTSTLVVSALPVEIHSLEATIIDVLGHPISHVVLAAVQGTARVQLPTTGLATGLYSVRLWAYNAQGGTVGELPAQHISVH